MEIFYLVYKLTNSVNGKIYIGCHMTKNVNDGYMGSGKRLGYAKKKYGIENFKKEILSTHETPEQMLIEEARLVNEEFLGRKDVYNLTLGGRGGWFAVNQDSNLIQIRNVKLNEIQSLKLKTDIEFKKRKSNVLKKLHAESMLHNIVHTRFDWTGHHRSEKTKQKIGASNSISQHGERNSQFGKLWVHCETQSKIIFPCHLREYLEAGWCKGRKMNFTKVNLG